jgi:transcriptional regulator with XRE-family HTH domain
MANERLRQAILGSGLSIDDLADQVGTDVKTVERWITKGRVPHPRNRIGAAQALGMDELALWPELADSRSRAVASSEVVQVYSDRGSVPPGFWYQMIGDAETHVDVLVIAGLFLTDGRADLPALLDRKARDGVAIRLLLADPESNAVVIRGEEEQVGDALAARVRMSMRYLRPAFEAPGLDVRLHDTTLYNSIFRVRRRPADQHARIRRGRRAISCDASATDLWRPDVCALHAKL